MQAINEARLMVVTMRGCPCKCPVATAVVTGDEQPPSGG